MLSFDKYFDKLTPSFVKFPFYAFRRSEFKNSNYEWRWFITNYKAGSSGSYKIELKDEMDPVFEEKWEWHHIVESGHLKPLFSEVDWKEIIETSTPCVLVDKFEHAYFFSSLLHGASVVANFNIRSSGHVCLVGEDRERYINQLRKHYDRVYFKYSELQIIASNFLNAIPKD